MALAKMAIRAKKSVTFAEDEQSATASSPAEYEQPSSTAKGTPSRLIRSRRRRYLERHPSYFVSASGALEHLEPLTYDRLIRQHQSAAERQAEGTTRGFARTLEASLLRGEAKLASLRPDMEADGADSSSCTASSAIASGQAKQGPVVDWSIAAVIDEEHTSSDMAKARAEAHWRELIAERFIQGHDDEFEYDGVDSDETLDADEGVSGTWKEREREAAWFDDEEPGGNDEEVDGETAKQLLGETGVQDF